MTPYERATAAMNLEKPDRVAICPHADMDQAARYFGVDTIELHEDDMKALDIMFKFYDELGGWDGYTTVPLTRSTFNIQGYKVKTPGRELPSGYQLQFDEGEWMKVEDYKTVADIGWTKFVMQDYIYRITDLNSREVRRMAFSVTNMLLKASREWNKRNIAVKMAGSYMHPFFALSLNRSLIKFTQDLYYRPELVEAALDTMTDEIITSAKAMKKMSGGDTIFVAEERAEAGIYPLKIFERFWMPFTKRIVDGFNDAGIRPWFHLDHNWDLNIPYFKELPRASCLLDFDGVTDIFRAKEILKDHLCLVSDVSASLFSLGTPQQVNDYVKKLIDKLGVDGGHILGSGCVVPPDCKIENFKAFVNTGKTYQLSKN